MSESSADWEIVHHPLKLRHLTVAAVDRPTSRVARVQLRGDLAGFRSWAPDDHVKVFFPRPTDGRLVVPTVENGRVVWPTTGPRPIARDYTPRRHDVATGTLEIDVVLHGDGPAACWAAEASAGDHVAVAGPRGSMRLRRDVDRVILLGDDTALPAMWRWVSERPGDAEVVAIAEVDTASDHVDLGDAAVTWLHRAGRAPGTTHLLDACSSEIVADADDRTVVWIAAEADVARRLRRMVPDAPVVRCRGYWKRGVSDHQEPHDD